MKKKFVLSVFIVMALALPSLISANTDPRQELDNGLLVSFVTYGEVACAITWKVPFDNQGSSYQEPFYYKHDDNIMSANGFCNCNSIIDPEYCECQGSVANPVPGGRYYFKLRENGVFPDDFPYFADIPVKLEDDAFTVTTTKSSATIEWQTDKETGSSVFYYIEGNDFAQNTVRDETLVKNHRLEITGIMPDTEYNFTVTSINGTGEGNISNLLSFRTLPGNNCTDTDGGRNYGTAGTATLEGQRVTSYNSDSCAIANDDYTLRPMSSCSGDSCYLREKVCGEDGASFFEERFPCPGGCADGACTHIDNKTCSETDNGDDRFNKGKIILSDGFEQEDTCGQSGYSVWERYCVDGGYVYSSRQCIYGCANGACKESPTGDNIDQASNANTTCADSDGGLNYYTKGYVSFTAFAEIKQDSCQDYYVNEYYCGGTASSTLMSKSALCDAFCVDGACTKDMENCLKLTGNDQEKCYIGFAKYEKDASICDNITRDGPKFTCITEVARALSDIDLCDTITNTSNRADCIIAFATDAHDPDICLRTMSANKNYNAYFQAMCYRHFQDSEICCRIEDERFRDVCDIGPPKAFSKYGTDFCAIFGAQDLGCHQAISDWKEQNRTIPDGYQCKNTSTHQMPTRLLGKIMIKVEDLGKAYYINPQSKAMAYLGRPDDAFAVMREQGVGITNADLYKIPIGVTGEDGLDSDGDGLSDYLEKTLGLDGSKADTDGDGYKDGQELAGGYSPWGEGRQGLDNKFVEAQAGKILLQVEKAGEAWYVNPADGKRYFLGRPADAFSVMRNLGLGISNRDFDDL